MQHLEKVRLAELIEEDERAAAFLETQLGHIRRRIATRMAELREASRVTQTLADAMIPPAEPPAPALTERQETDNTLNHQSGCGLNVDELRKRFLDYLNSHGVPGQWLGRTDMCRATDAWTRWGKHVVDKVLDDMVAECIVEVKSFGHGKGVRLHELQLSKSRPAPEQII
jgi:hypothetical protein